MSHNFDYASLLNKVCSVLGGRGSGWATWGGDLCMGASEREPVSFWGGNQGLLQGEGKEKTKVVKSQFSRI